VLQEIKSLLFFFKSRLLYFVFIFLGFFPFYAILLIGFSTKQSIVLWVSFYLLISFLGISLWGLYKINTFAGSLEIIVKWDKIFELPEINLKEKFEAEMKRSREQMSMVNNEGSEVTILDFKPCVCSYFVTPHFIYNNELKIHRHSSARYFSFQFIKPLSELVSLEGAPFKSRYFLKILYKNGILHFFLDDKKSPIDRGHGSWLDKFPVDQLVFLKMFGSLPEKRERKICEIYNIGFSADKDESGCNVIEDFDGELIGNQKFSIGRINNYDLKYFEISFTEYKEKI